MDYTEIREPFEYLGLEFTPAYQLDDSAFDSSANFIGSPILHVLNSCKAVKSFQRAYVYDDFYETAKRAGAGDFDIFECEGHLFIPTSGALLEYKPDDVSTGRGAALRKKKISIETSAVLFMVKGTESEDCFYPTPESIAREMLSDLNWSLIHYILEPSAGKGDLAKMIPVIADEDTGYFEYFSRFGCQIDCIEINPALQAVLRGNGCRVVHDDFTTFHSEMHYDLIVMNPPFRNGDKHLMKALAMQEHGGQIRCLLNAETILNPCTSLRKELRKLLDKYHAQITFFEEAFSDAERPTDVRIALVKVDIPPVIDKSDIYERMQAAEQAEECAFGTPSDLIPADFVQGLICQYNVEIKAGKELIRQFFALQPYIRKTRDQKDTEGSLLTLMCGNKDASFNEFIKAVRHKYWVAFLENDTLYSKLTSQMHKKYRCIIDSLTCYEFNEFNIRQIMDQMFADLYAGMEESIMAIFDKLTTRHTYHAEIENGNVHYYNGWCSNKAYKVADKVVIPAYGLFPSYEWSHDTFYVQNAYDKLADIEKALNYLDGGATREVDAVMQLSNANNNGVTRNIPLKYFDVTFYKKGTCHIKFRVSDPTVRRLLDKLNIYASRKKGWLPPSYGKKKYQDMDAEEQRVIQEFQGEAAYAKVLEESGYYLVETKNIPLLSN